MFNNLGGKGGLTSITHQGLPFQRCSCSFTPLFSMARALLVVCSGAGSSQGSVSKGGSIQILGLQGWDMAPC